MAENVKEEILEKLERAISKLKEARLEIHEAVLTALEMKEKADGIADEVIKAMAALAVDDFEALAWQTQREKRRMAA